MYIVAFIVSLPFNIASLWAKLFKVKISGQKITVKKAMGLAKFSFDVLEIAAIKWRIKMNAKELEELV